MKFNEITKDYEISITVFHKGTRAAFSTQPMFTLDDALYVQPFTHGNAYLSFNITEAKIEMTAYKDKSIPYYWRAVTITREEKNGRTYHVIRSKFDGVKLNRRSSHRHAIGSNGLMADMLGSYKEDVKIRDISATGIGVATKPGDKPGFARGSRVRITYTDPYSTYSVDVFCRVVRVLKRKNDYLYGCSFTRVYPEIARYIATRGRFVPE